MCTPCKGIIYRCEKMYASKGLYEKVSFLSNTWIHTRVLFIFLLIPKPCFQWILWRAWNLSSKLKHLSGYFLENSVQKCGLYYKMLSSWRVIWLEIIRMVSVIFFKNGRKMWGLLEIQGKVYQIGIIRLLSNEKWEWVHFFVREA